MNAPSQKDNSGIHQEQHLNDRAGLFTAIIAFGIAMLALGVSWWAIDKAKTAETQLLLLREDIREWTIDRAKEGKP